MNDLKTKENHFGILFVNKKVSSTMGAFCLIKAKGIAW